MKKLFRAGAVAVATLLASNAMAFQVGDLVPELKLNSTSGDLHLSQALAKGPVVLAFYYADFTSG